MVSMINLKAIHFFSNSLLCFIAVIFIKSDSYIVIIIILLCPFLPLECRLLKSKASVCVVHFQVCKQVLKNKTKPDIQ